MKCSKGRMTYFSRGQAPGPSPPPPLSWTKPNQLYHTLPPPKLRLCQGVVGAGVVAEEGVVEEDPEEVVVILIQRHLQTPIQTLRHLPVRSTGELNIQIFRQGSGKDVRCILNGGGAVISVPSPLPALGKTCTHPDLKNEKSTSSATKQFQLTQ